MFTCGSLLIFAVEFISSNGHPIDPKVVLPVSNGFGFTVFGAALLITTVIALIACTCCKQRRDGFKEFRNPTASGHIGFTNTLSELAIFPPPVTVQQQHPPSDDGSPQINTHPPSRPAAFSCAVPSVTDWFVDSNGNFPRQQLFYQKEIGKGWFGKVVKGEARGAKVVVRILREDATPEEKGYFLHEAKPFRDLKHKNISRLYGRCLEHDPFLLLFEYCTNGDLKSFLVTNSGSRNAITEQKISLKMMIDVTEGLKFMNEHGFIHTDLAARNCLVASDLTVKIGDYGTSVDKYKDEYYIVGDVAVPIRWCAPETLTCTQTTIETKQVTEGGNVWSLAVLLWEIAEFGKLPYLDLADDDVITRVLVQGSVRLPPPNCSFGHYLHNVMTLCWRMENRANIEQILMMLMYLKNNPFQESDFESRWKALKPNTVVVVDNHTPIHSPRHTELAQRPHLTAKLEFDSGVDLEIKPTDENPDSCRTSTPTTVSPQLSVASEDIFQPVQHKSPSMTNLKGSLEDVAQFDSWLMGVEQKTEEDRTFVKNISEAIKNLDETLALEKTSSSSQDSSMEGSKKPLLEFKLGPTGSDKKGDSSSSDTEEETWRNRIERGEFTEKVKEKSKSVTDLMVLTHIDSEGSESDSLPSLTRQYSVKKTTVKGVSYTGIGFGSEGNIRNAVLSEELQDKLKQLTTWKTETQSFLVKGASEKNNKNLSSMGAKETSVPVILMGDKDSSVPISSNTTTTPPIAAMGEDTSTCTPIISYCSDSPAVESNPTTMSGFISEENSIVNMKSKPVNKESVMDEGKNVNNDCINDRFVENEHSVISNVGISDSVSVDDCFPLVVDSKQSASSHCNKNSVPEIVITESEISQILDEPEPSVDTKFVVDIKPRKFVFVCKDTDMFSDSSGEDDSPQNIEEPIETQKEGSSSVILGSCEEHTLDYFKGLKTTFTPNVSYVGINENLPAGNSDLLGDYCLKEESNDFEKHLKTDETLLEAALTTFNGKPVINAPEDPDQHYDGEHKRTKRDDRFSGEDFAIGEENVSKNNVSNFCGLNESFVHIIDSFIDNERAYTSIGLDKELYADISVDPKNSFPVEEVLGKNIVSNLDNTSNPYKIQNTFTAVFEEQLVDAPIGEKIFSKEADLTTSSCSIENAFTTGTSSEKHLVEAPLENMSTLLKDLDSLSTVESPFLTGNSSEEHLDYVPIDKKKYFKEANLSSPIKIENPFTPVICDEHLAKAPPVVENIFSKEADNTSPCIKENTLTSEISEILSVEAPLNEQMFSKQADLDISSTLNSPFTSGHSSEACLVDNLTNKKYLSKEANFTSLLKMENPFTSVMCEEHSVENSIGENIFSNQVDHYSPPQIENSSLLGSSPEERLLDVPNNENEVSKEVNLSSTLKMEIPITPVISEELLKVSISENMFTKHVDLDSPPKTESFFSSGNSSEEHLVDTTIDEDKFSKKVELSSPSKTGSTLSGNSTEEHFVEAPFPFNQPEPVEIHSNITSVKAKSLDSFLSPKNGYEHFVTLRNGLYVEDDSIITNFVPVFNMTESVSENTFMSQNLYYDPYFSVDSGHSSDRCMEQDKKMNDLKNRLEDVVKSGNDFQLKNSEEEYGGKLLTPDDERSSDSGFRDKGSLSESVEDTCDEKYNLEDIDAELDEFTLKNIDKEDLKYYEQFVEPDQEATPGWFLHIRPESTVVDAKDSGWLSQSTEDEERLPLTIDAEFAAAIRNELKEKLPCAQQIEKAEEDASPEQEPATDKFTYPSQLSPILEEQESNQSSLQLNDCSPVFILPPPEIKTDTFKQDIVKAFESLESSKNGVIMEDLEDENRLMVFSDDKIIVDDDVLIVDTETNEATLIESPKPQSHLAFILTKKELEPYIENDSPELNSDIYVLTPDNAPLTPNSVNSDSHSSPENANMSGLFLSPCSIRSDLFDSGPPSLPFDLGQSLEEVEDIPACEETLIENLAPEICNGNSAALNHVMDNKKSILKENETEFFDNKQVDAMNIEITKVPTEKHEQLNIIKNVEEDNKKCIDVTLGPSSPADSNLKPSLSDDKVLKQLRAEVEIDRLLSRSNKENEIENTNHINSNSSVRNDWLKDLFTNINGVEISNKEDKNHVNSNLRKTDWPTIEELVLEKPLSKIEQNNCLKPNITSTLALMSPDLSSADSKSLASSFSSTPSSDENKTVAMSTEDSDSFKYSEKLVKPNSLNLKNDASGAPMPSPEDAEKGWRPTICQLMELTDQAAADGEEMTTSFIEPDENGIYTPDWESDISEEQSSSSGEFVWKEGDTEDLLKCVGTDTNSLNDELIGGGMERIEEEDEDCSSCDDSDTSSETSSGTEFVPSTWNAMAVPMKSALKVNPPQKKNEKKRVVFKKEKYQCIYEYPREESDNEEEEFSPGMWQTPSTPVFDYSVFADWELGDGEIVSTPIDCIDSDSEESKKSSKKEETEFDFYRLDYNPATNLDRPWSDSLPEDDADFSPLAADLAPVRLGDLRHTKATLRLELPQLRPDQGEASILDSVSDVPP